MVNGSSTITDIKLGELLIYLSTYPTNYFYDTYDQSYLVELREILEFQHKIFSCLYLAGTILGCIRISDTMSVTYAELLGRESVQNLKA